ncbi:NAD kinase [Candidatus Endowatersipora endosymbiont of Watersipora subatra]|uniref:NAD kinase n=1 Tax=Candidatus Endowatersipora endosymbiont of Watersipora subatra TaxID=3077946 RepID=UPI00312CA003
MHTSYPKIAFVSSKTEIAQSALCDLVKRYGNYTPDNCDLLVALGGDGFMLKIQLTYMSSGIPVYGMNKGTIGFLMNRYRKKNLLSRLDQASRAIIHPLRMVAHDIFGKKHESVAFNEVSLFRQSHQAARLRIHIDKKERMKALICDGVIVSTPQGSTAYNLSVHGPILPMKAPLLALTPVSPFRPRNWNGALLPNTVNIRITILEPKKRLVNAVADNTEIKSALTVDIQEDREAYGIILFDPEHSWEERILAEQFRYK